MNCPLAKELANRLREAREDMTQRWLDRIKERVTIDEQQVFPTEALLDHVPLLMDGIADYMEDPADEIGADDTVLAKAMELGELRFAQGFGPHEVLKEYEILGNVLFHFMTGIVDEIERECTRAELLACGHRLFRAITVIQQITTTHYLRVADERVRDREERLRGFNRLVTHELKNRIGAVGGAAEMLRERWIVDDGTKRERFLSIISENATGMEAMLEDLLLLSRTDPDTRPQRNVELPAVATEAAHQLRAMARERGVEIRIADDLPRVEVDSATVELCLVNYLSNGIKYADPDEDTRWVEVRGRYEKTDGGAGELIVAVQDNGIGVPPERRARLFERFYRAHEAVAGVDGTGLGLSIVRDTIEAIGGRAWAEFEGGGGSTFLFAVPDRDDDAEGPAVEEDPEE
jgi:signal transduction histidine kinase